VSSLCTPPLPAYAAVDSSLTRPVCDQEDGMEGTENIEKRLIKILPKNRQEDVNISMHLWLI
jgi:hypothetical protein